MLTWIGAILLALLIAPDSLSAQAGSPAPPTPGCSSCAEWNAPTEPFRVHGNTYYVGTRGLGALLITSDQGHVLIDGGLPESAARIAESIRALGFRPEDVRLILNSHAHFDHAGGLAALQRLSGATVAVSPWSARVLRTGASLPDDPQHGVLIRFPAVSSLREIADGEVLRVGPLALTARFTPGHTPGGTSWSWRSCEGERCLEMVYADSQTPVSADGFLYTRSRAYPKALADFERGLSLLERIPCDLLITPHPGASGLWERVAKRDAGAPEGLADDEGCRRYAATARQAIARRIATEAGRP